MAVPSCPGSNSRSRNSSSPSKPPDPGQSIETLETRALRETQSMATASIEPSSALPIDLPATAASHHEVVGGHRVETVRLGAFESVLATILTRLLAPFVWERKLGHMASETLFVLDRSQDLQRRPDLAFVSRERWPMDRKVPMTVAWDVVPDLAIEVVSPSNSAFEVVTKLADYFRSGVRLVWVVYPHEFRVQVWESPAGCRAFGPSEILDGGDVLPGFRLPLEELFELA